MSPSVPIIITVAAVCIILAATNLLICAVADHQPRRAGRHRRRR